MLEESTNELEDRQCEHLGTLGSRWGVLECDAIILYCDNSRVTDGNAKDIRSQILEDSFGVVADSLGIDNPTAPPNMLRDSVKQTGLHHQVSKFGLNPELPTYLTKLIAVFLGENRDIHTRYFGARVRM